MSPLRELASVVVHLDRDAGQGRVHPLDAVDHLIHELQRRDLFAANQLRQINRVKLRKFFHEVHSHGCRFRLRHGMRAEWACQTRQDA